MGTNSSDNNINSEHVLELVSPYIDNALDAADRELVRAHIDSCETCAAEYRELQAMQQMLRAMPVQAPPRAFTLTEEMVGAKARSVARPSLLARIFGSATAPRLATGSVLAFALLIIMLVSDLGVLSPGSPLATSPANIGFRTEKAQEAAPLNMVAASTSTTSAAAEATATTGAVAEAMPVADQTAALGGAGGSDEAYAAPTTLPLANMAQPTDTASAEAQGGTQSEAPPPASTTLPEDQANSSAQEGTPSPGTDTTYYNLQVPGTGLEDEKAAGGEAPLAQSPASGSGSFPVTLAIEIGLALLAIALAVGATLARRRSV
ncbi:MAG TPA: zf-HC2 domain-containing protein [Chloroflexia bacterium]|jgi:anti-sigma factor RsiW